jgi:dienelactone hydrolase
MNAGEKVMNARLPVAWMLAGIVFSFVGADAPKVPTPRLPRENLKVFRASDGQIKPVTSIADWWERRAEILRGMQSVMGTLPGPEKRCALDVKVEEEVDCGTYVRRFIAYASEPGCRVPAYLCVPKELLKEGAKRAPGVLCLHPTDNAVGHGVLVGLGGRASLPYASELAERGYVTLAPSYPLLAKYQPDVKALGWESGTLKAVWDNMRGLDLLESLPYVAPVGFGAIGHSLGGHNSVYTAVFDQRIKVVVSSCGLDSFLDYYDGDPKNWLPEKGWCQTRYMPKLADYRGRLQDIPFDFHEMIAAIAPRRVLIMAPLQDSNFRWASVDKVVVAAERIYDLYPRPGYGYVSVLHPDGPHDFPEPRRTAAYETLDEVLRPETVKPKK